MARRNRLRTIERSRRVEGALRWALPVLVFLVVGLEVARAQDNFDIQVYRSRTVAPKTTLVELQSNLVADGTKDFAGTVYPATQLYPTDDALHETLQIRQGLNDWSEVGFYVLTSAQSGHGWQWVGDDLRAQVQAPERWQWRLGAGLAVEVGYQRPPWAVNNWTIRLQPIFDKRLGRWYFAVNPAFDWSLRGENSGQGAGFAPSAKFSYAFSRHVAAGGEYYGNYGKVEDISGFHHQQQQFFPTMDVNFSPEWKLNIGVGIGVTTITDDWIWKANLSRSFDWRRRAGSTP